MYLLDPAVGTGTYLIEVCQLVYAHHTGNGEPAAVAAGKVQAALTSRLTGFEILPAAFIICHLHLARYVLHLQAPDEDARPRVYLTNSLTGWGADADPAGSTLFPELEEELRDAAVAKRRDPVLVVLGNPPYQGYSTAETAEEKAMLAPWSQELTSAWGLRKHRLNDLYVRFWRIAIERIVHLTERGVISFISNRKWLGGRSYPSMRHALVANFDSIWVDDLHGDVHDRSHPGDESVFKTNIATGIKVGTAIVTAVRTHTTPGQRAAVAWRRDYRGPAAGKRHRLALRAEHGWFTQVYDPLTPTAASRYRLAPDAAGDNPLLDEYLPFFLSGVQPVRDEAVLDTDPARLEARMRSYFDPKLSTPDLLTRHPAFAVVRARYNPARVRIEVLNAGGYDPKRLVRLLYRPMDTRWMYWETASKLLNESRTELLPYWRNVPDQVCLVAAQTPRRDGAVRPAAGHAVGAFASVDPDARVFPLYEPASKLLGEDAGELALDTSGGSGASAVLRTTVAPDWVAATRATLGLPADATGDLTAGETVFYALLAVMHSPEWIASQPVDQDDFPSVPLPADPTELAAAATTGRELLALLDPDQDVPGVTSGTIRAHLRPLAVEDSTPGTVTLTGRYGFTGGDYQGSDVLWGAGGGWRNVPAAVWEFTIGGFPVLSKWLSYRVTSGLTAADRATFRLLVRRIQAILDLAGDCDSAYTAAAAAPLTLP